MRDIGERISWRGMNRTESGIIEDVEQNGYLVSLDAGKQVIVPESSVLEESSS